jgi:ATP-dependent protease ClpP protease subunit
MWRDLIAVAELPGVDPDSLWIAGTAAIKGDGGTMHGSVFPIRYGDSAAVGITIAAECFSYSMSREVTAGTLRAIAHGAEDARGLFVVREVEMQLVSRFAAGRVWFRGVSPEDAADRQWYARALAASVKPPKAMPGRMRPHGKEVRSLQLIGEIGKGIDGYSMDRAIREAADATILVNINSPGGCTDHGGAIYSALAAHPKRVETHVIGKAHSMAAQIALAGDFRTIVSDGSLMVHEATWHAPVNGVAAARRLAAVAERSLNTEATIIARQAGVPIATALGWIKAGKQFNAASALTNGLVHEIMADIVPLKPAARRARFQPVNGPFQAIRPGPKAYSASTYYHAGQVALHAGRRWRAVSGGRGCTPGNDSQWRAF